MAATEYCAFSVCATMSDWKDVATIVVTILALPGVYFAAVKTWQEVRNLRLERAHERASRIHAQQLDALRDLFAKLTILKAALSKAKPAAAPTDGTFKSDPFHTEFSAAFDSARDSFRDARLLLPLALVSKIKGFLDEAVLRLVKRTITQLKQVSEPEAEPPDTAEFFLSARRDALQELLDAIEEEARNIIYGETKTTSKWDRV